VVRGEDVVAVGQGGDQLPEHARAGREAVQQQDDRCAGRAGLAVEDSVTEHSRRPVVNLDHL
jgi:hypothetical protein